MFLNFNPFKKKKKKEDEKLSRFLPNEVKSGA